MDTHVAAPQGAARPSVSRDLGAVAAAPPHEPAVRKWPGWVRVTILLGGSMALWLGLGWVAFLILKLA